MKVFLKKKNVTFKDFEETLALISQKQGTKILKIVHHNRSNKKLKNENND